MELNPDAKNKKPDQKWSGFLLIFQLEKFWKKDYSK